MVSSQSSTVETAARAFGLLAVLSAAVAAGALLFPTPLADAFFAAWVVGGVAVAALGAYATWTKRTPLVWVTALLLVGLSVAGMWSIGAFIAPAALCLLAAAVLGRAAGPREGVREAIVADPPSVPEAVTKTLAGAAAVVAGVALVYVGSIARELFGSCARETLTCALGATRWDAVGVTLAGLVAVVAGCWLLWTQLYAARVLSARRVG